MNIRISLMETVTVFGKRWWNYEWVFLPHFLCNDAYYSFNNDNINFEREGVDH